MKSFKQFLLEQGDNDVWKEIDHHDQNAPEHIKKYIDRWVGVSHQDIKDGTTWGLMIPSSLEDNHQEVHAAGEPIRQALRKHHGDVITAYRGEPKNPGVQSTGRKNILHSYTTDKRVAARFAGAPSYRRKVYSDEEINHHQREYDTHGSTTLSNGRSYRRDPEWGSVDMFDKHGNHITDTPSVRYDMESDRDDAREHNSLHDEALGRVKEVKIPVDQVVWATNRANQKELIVRKK